MRAISFSLRLLFIVSTLHSCQTIKPFIAEKQIHRTIQKSEIFNNQFTGISLYDPLDNAFLIRHNDHLLFTPASTTKILTAFAALQTLGDSIASFRYFNSGDSIYLEPMADGTFLYSPFPEQPAYHFLKNKYVFIKQPDNTLKRFGPGWAWDDYEYSFQPECSWFPIYGNIVRIFNQDDSISIVPGFFEAYTDVITGEKPGSHIYRWENANIFNARIASDTSAYERKIPFQTSNELLIQLLRDTLNSQVQLLDSIPSANQIFYSQSTQHTLAMMMQPSDNMLAEHLLMQCALIEGYTHTSPYREMLLNRWSPMLPDPIRWVDGSGLSRYNLISPRNMVGILQSIYANEEWRTIEAIFPTGGQSGTIKKWYAASEPYVYAKTGTLSNNHNLCGYIKTRSGKTLIFSIMNNHFSNPTHEIKREMQMLLEIIRDTY